MTRSSRRARRSAAGRARPRTTAARSSTASRRCWRAARPVRVRSRRRGGPVEVEGGDRPGGRRRSTAGSGTRAGPTRSRQVAGGANPVAGPVLQPLDARADGCGRRPRPSGVLVPGPGLGARPGDRHGQHGGRRTVRAGPASRALALGEVLATSDLPGRRRQRPLGPYARRSRRRSPRTRTSTRSTSRGSRGRGAGEGAGDRRGGQPQARPAPGQSVERTGPPTPALQRCWLPGDEDGLAPDRRLTRPRHGRTRQPGWPLRALARSCVRCVLWGTAQR